MSDDRKNGGNTDGRNPDGTFGPGNSGKPQGARNKTTRAVMDLMEGQGDALAQKAISMALEGDSTALRLCLEGIAPARKDNAIEFDLPEMECAEDAAKAAGAVLNAVAEGELTPLEAASVMSLIATYRLTLETTEFERRLSALEDSK